MIKPAKADYECVCFRAGGFYAQPSRNIISAMKKVRLQADSSGVKFYKTSTPFEVDNSHVETDKVAWWTTDTELTGEGNPGQNIIELSVSSRMQSFRKNFKSMKLRAALKRQRAERALINKHTTDRGIRSVLDYRTVLRKLHRSCPSTFDFCKLPCGDMLRRIKEHSKYPEKPILVNCMLRNMYSGRGFFYCRKTRLLTSRIPYMRWSRAWAFHALTEYLLAKGACIGS